MGQIVDLAAYRSRHLTAGSSALNGDILTPGEGVTIPRISNSKESNDLSGVTLSTILSPDDLVRVRLLCVQKESELCAWERQYESATQVEAERVRANLLRALDDLGVNTGPALLLRFDWGHVAEAIARTYKAISQGYNPRSERGLFLTELERVSGKRAYPRHSEPLTRAVDKDNMPSTGALKRSETPPLPRYQGAGDQPEDWSWLQSVSEGEDGEDAGDSADLQPAANRVDDQTKVQGRPVGANPAEQGHGHTRGLVGQLAEGLYQTAPNRPRAPFRPQPERRPVGYHSQQRPIARGV